MYHKSYQRTSSLLSDHKSRLPPEVEEGNIEYKLKLVKPSPERIDHLTTQLKWRLAEGNGEAIYEIGVSDKGKLVGLDASEMEQSMETLERMAKSIGAQLSILRTKKVKERSVVEVLFRKGQDDQHFLEIRVAMLGGADAGKSTLLSVLCYGDKDDGEGTARLNLLRHRHEIETGRSSSISRQILGFTANGQPINYATTNVSTWEQVCENATRIVTFMDTCGHPKYQKTTVGGLTGDAPDYACLILSASFGGLPEVSREHVMLTKLLKVPLLIIITKIDVASANQLGKTLEALMKLLKSPGINRVPVVIQNEDDLASSMSAITSNQLVPLFLTSNVTGENTNLLISLFNRLPKPLATRDEALESDMQLQIQDIFSVSGLGTVVGGTMLTGQIYMAGNNPQLCFLGPDHGKFIPVIVHSVHRQRIPVKSLQAGQVGTCALKFFREKQYTDAQTLNVLDHKLWTQTIPNDFKLRRGQVLIPISLPTTSYWQMIVDLSIITHPNALFIGQEVKLHIGSINQPAKVVSISHSLSPSPTNNSTLPTPTTSPKSPLEKMSGLTPVGDMIVKSKKQRHSVTSLTPGTTGFVTFRFSNEPEYLCTGSSILIRDPEIKCVGKVISCQLPHIASQQ